MASASLSPSVSPSLSPSASPSASPSQAFLDLEVILPLLQMFFDGHVWFAEVSITLPIIQTSITGLSGVGGGKIKMEMPLVGASVTGHVSVTGEVSAKIPLPYASINGYSGIVGSFALTLPPLNSLWTELPSSRGTFSLTLPLFLSFIYGRPTPFTISRKGVVMNIENHAVTEYKNYNFNSLAMWNGIILGTNEEGLYLLDSEEYDIGTEITSYIQSGTYDLGEGAIKIPREAWMTYRSSGDMDIEIKEDESAVYNYNISKVTSGIKECRAKLGKGFRGRFYRFGIRNISGCDFDIHSFRVLAEVIKRKAR